MKWTKLYGAVVAMLGMVGTANAGSILLTSHTCGGAEKSCGCAPSCQPQCCRPVICRPTCPKVCTYQRSCCKPGCGVGPANGCGPRCGNGGMACGNNGACGNGGPAACGNGGAGNCGPANCAAPAACDPGHATCAAPARAACGPICDPGRATCAVPAACGPAAVNCGPTAPAASCCEKKTCCADPCEVAHWIYESQTACYARCRRSAIRKLGKYDCTCNPEIMCAFIYGLNDCDEKVRKESARQIRKQTKCHPCCCNDKVVAALTCALSDCDKGVRKEAEKALCQCGYDVQDCNTGCAPACTASATCAVPSAGACGTHAAPATTPAPVEGGEAAPAPAPAPAAAEPEAYFPSRLKNQQTKSKKSSGLSNLFGLRG